MAESSQSRPPELNVEHKRTLFARVRARLSAPPPPPSEVVNNALAIPLVPQNANAADVEAGSASTHELSLDAVTTSVVLTPKLFSIHKIHVAPFEAIDTDLMVLWEQEIRERLCAILKYEITTGTYVQECIMAGRRADDLKPTILVTSSDIPTKKCVEKAFKGHTMKWLRELVKEKDMQLVAAVEVAALSS